MSKIKIELVWHNCKDCPPQEEKNTKLHITNGQYVHPAYYNKDFGWISTVLGTLIPDSILHSFWWCDLEQAVKEIPELLKD